MNNSRRGSNHSSLFWKFADVLFIDEAGNLWGFWDKYAAANYEFLCDEYAEVCEEFGEDSPEARALDSEFTTDKLYDPIAMGPYDAQSWERGY